MKAPARAVVVGAGISGLVAGRELRRRGHHVIVLEAAGEIAGLASTTVGPDGFSFDLGAHFITNRLAAAVGISGRCHPVRYYGESVWLDGRYYRYPAGLLRRPAFVGSAIAAKLHHRSEPAESAGEWFRQQYGAVLADAVAVPLLEGWSGVPAGDLAPSVADKIPSSLAETIRLRTALRLSRRAVAIGYCGEQPQSSAVFHVYPEQGVSAICEHLASELDGAVRTNTPAKAIVVNEGRAVGVETNDELLEADVVVSTAPVHVLPKLVHGSDKLERFARFRFRGMIAVSLKLDGTSLLRDVVVWTPHSVPFFRMTEASRSMPWLAPAGRTAVLCDIGADVGEERWSMGDDELAELCLDGIAPFVADVRQRYLGVHVQRIALAYPVFHRDYEQDRQRLERDGTGVENLLSVGRNGEFAHVLMEDVYWRTVRRVRSWMSS